MTFLNKLAENIHTYPNKVALEFIDPPFQMITYSELGELVQQTTSYLHNLGVQPGDRVALQLPKSLEFILLQLATIQSGAISLPLNLAYPPDEIEYFLSDSGARLFFALESAKARLQPKLSGLSELNKCIFLNPNNFSQFGNLISKYRISNTTLPELNPDDTAVIIYTSGTTGRPKGAEITHQNLTSNLNGLYTAWRWKPDDILLHVLPIFHVHGLFVALYGSLFAGATTLLMREFDAHLTIRSLVERKCSVFMAVPTIHKRLLSLSDANHFDLSHLRLITSGSDRLPDEVFLGFKQTFNQTLLERYGMTETGMNLSNPLNGERRMGSVGMPLPGVEARVADPETNKLFPDGEIGEIQLRGLNVFKGYWRQPEKTAEAFTPDGWFRTGDLGFRQADGYFTLCGRSKDLIISGGLNIYPPEVERVLNEHPAVETSAVIGCKDAEWGERVLAVVVKKNSASVTHEDLISYCRQHLAPYKSPKMIVFKDELPRNAMGKVLKADLKKIICKDLR
jgi:malonyl-CoA/methylmalonyl-CoA synthetase